MALQAIDAFVERLAESPAGPNSVNEFDHSRPGNAIRRRNLELYLEQLADHRPKTLLLGEAPSYRGMRITGVPFTNVAIIEQGLPSACSVLATATRCRSICRESPRSRRRP